MTLNELHEIIVLLSFFAHMVFINLLLGGIPIMVVTQWLSRWENFRHLRTLGQQMREMSPKVLGLAVLLGFFVWITVYSRYDRPVLDMMGAFKAGYGLLLILLILVFLGIFSFKGRKGSSILLQIPEGVLVTLTMLALGGMALLFVISHIMTLHPSYTEIVDERGLLASLTLPTLWPRFSHMILGSIAATGILITLYGTLGSPLGSRGKGLNPTSTADFDVHTTRYGVAWTLAGTLPQTVVGPWLLFVLPMEVREPLVSGASLISGIFFVSLTLALLALVLLNASLMVPHVRVLVWSGLGSLFLTFVLMVVIREEVRKVWMEVALEKGTMEEISIGTIMGVITILLLVLFLMNRYLKRIFQDQRPLT